MLKLLVDVGDLSDTKHLIEGSNVLARCEEPIVSATIFVNYISVFTETPRTDREEEGSWPLLSNFHLCVMT